MEKHIIGLTEKIKINGKPVLARIDTGATTNSICVDLASELKLGPIVKTSTILSSSNGREVRPVVKASLEIGGRKFNASFNISNRAHMRYRVLIGQKILKKGFLIDPSKKEPA